jgi:hypothetical protein
VTGLHQRKTLSKSKNGLCEHHMVLSSEESDTFNQWFVSSYVSVAFCIWKIITVSAQVNRSDAFLRKAPLDLQGLSVQMKRRFFKKWTHHFSFHTYVANSLETSRNDIFVIFLSNSLVWFVPFMEC